MPISWVFYANLKFYTAISDLAFTSRICNFHIADREFSNGIPVKTYLSLSQSVCHLSVNKQN